MKTPANDGTARRKRAKILEAAIRVFAAKGYHGCRVSDIAAEAEIAYGLVYHYFKSKEEILNSIFIEKWSVFLEVIRQIDRKAETLEEKLRQIVHFLLSGYDQMPELMEVLILEIARSQKVMEDENLKALNEAFLLVERMIRAERERGGLRPGIDPRLASFTFFGAVENILTGYVLKTLKKPDAKSSRKVESFVIDSFLRGIAER